MSSEPRKWRLVAEFGDLDAEQAEQAGDRLWGVLEVLGASDPELTLEPAESQEPQEGQP
jgi:hypothetical protein